MATKVQLSTLGTVAFALLLPALQLTTGCSVDGPVGALGFVDVTWKINGKPAGVTTCAAVKAKQVRVNYGVGTPDLYDCDGASTVRRSAGADAKLDLRVELLSSAGKILASKTKTVKVIAGETSTFVVDFFGAAVPDGGPGDASSEMGSDASSDLVTSDSSTAD